MHDDGVGGRRGSSERRSRRDTTAARGATNAAGRTTTTAATAVTITILVAGREEALHATGRHRRSFSLYPIQSKLINQQTEPENG